MRGEAGRIAELGLPIITLGAGESFAKLGKAPGHGRQSGRHDQGRRGGIQEPFPEIGAHPPEEVQEDQPQDGVGELV